MAKDTSRKATPRAKTPLKRDATMGASRGTKAVSMPSGRKAKVSLPKTKAAPKVAGPSKRERPAKPSKLRAPKSSPRAKAAAGTNPSSGARRPTGAEAREERLRHNSAPVGKIVARVLTIVAALAIVALIAYILLRMAMQTQKAVAQPLAFARLVRLNIMHKRPISQLSRLSTQPQKTTAQMEFKWT